MQHLKNGYQYFTFKGVKHKACSQDKIVRNNRLTH